MGDLPPSSMSSPRPPRGRHDGEQRAIDSLSQRSGVSTARIRALVAREIARLELGATVRSYLSVLAVASVRGMLGRAGASLRTVAERIRLSPFVEPLARELADWENEGGRTARPSTAAGR
jgi:hypothetical protein